MLPSPHQSWGRSRGGDADLIERGGERRLAGLGRVPRQDRDDQEHPEHVENEHAADERVRRARDRLLRPGGLRRRDRGDLRPHEREDHDDDSPGSRPWMIVAPAVASTASTITQKYQYSQPTEN